MDTHGYITDFLCYDKYFTLHNPHWLRYVAARSGVLKSNHPDFNYCEIGCGHGQTLAINAAANPQAQFYGLDINEGHYDSMVQYRNLLNIDNLHPSQADILQPQNLPQMDFIVAHGFISWVVPEVMLGMCEFIKKHLKPGGLVMLSYDTLPGCVHREQIANIMQRHIRNAPDLTTGLQEGMQHLAWLHNNKSNMFKMMSLLENDFKKLGTLQDVAHQYGNRYYKGHRFEDVNHWMNDIGLMYVGNVDTHRDNIQLCLKQEVTNNFPVVDAVQREILMQEMLNIPFTVSLFHKPTSGDSINSDDMVFTNGLPRNWMHASGQTPLGNVSIGKEIGTLLLNELESPKKISSLPMASAITYTLIALNQYIFPVCDTSARQTIDPKPYVRAYLQESSSPFVPFPSPVVGSGIGVPSEIACIIVSGGLSNAIEFAKECDKEWSSKVTKAILPDVKKYREHLKRLGAWKR